MYSMSSKQGVVGIMDLTCTCSHLRIEHDGGKKAVNDRRIGVCSVETCTCEEYNANKESRQRKTDLLLASLGIAVIIIGCCVVGFIITWFVIDYALQDYTVTLQYEYKKFLDGEEVKSDVIFGNEMIEPKEQIKTIMKSIVGFIFLSVAMFGSIFSFDSIYTSKIKQLRKGELK